MILDVSENVQHGALQHFLLPTRNILLYTGPSLRSDRKGPLLLSPWTRNRAPFRRIYATERTHDQTRYVYIIR